MGKSEFAKRLDIALKGDNLHAFSKKSGVGYTPLRKYLNGSKPGMDNLILIAKASGVSLEWLATGDGSPFEPYQVVEITPEVSGELDMKEQYVQAIFERIYTLQANSKAEMNAKSFYFTLSMLHQLMLERFGGKDVPDDQMASFLNEYVDKLVKKAGW